MEGRSPRYFFWSLFHSILNLVLTKTLGSSATSNLFSTKINVLVGQNNPTEENIISSIFRMKIEDFSKFCTQNCAVCLLLPYIGNVFMRFKKQLNRCKQVLHCIHPKPNPFRILNPSSKDSVPTTLESLVVFEPPGGQITPWKSLKISPKILLFKWKSLKYIWCLKNCHMNSSKQYTICLSYAVKHYAFLHLR